MLSSTVSRKSIKNVIEISSQLFYNAQNRTEKASSVFERRFKFIKQKYFSDSKIWIIIDLFLDYTIGFTLSTWAWDACCNVVMTTDK